MIDLLKKYREVIAYLFFGVMTTIVSWFSYSICTILLRQQTKEFVVLGIALSAAILVSNIISWICAVLFAFITNKLFVFQSRSWKKHIFLPEFWKFFSSRVVTGILEITAVPLLVGIGLDQTIWGVEGMMAKIIVSVVVVVLNYVFSKIFVFKKKNI